MPLPAFAMPTTLRAIALTASKAGQSRQGRVRHQYHASTAASITTIRPTPRHVLLPPETHHAVSPIARLYLYLDSIQQQKYLTM
jgi:hypothetical protein